MGGHPINTSCCTQHHLGAEWKTDRREQSCWGTGTLWLRSNFLVTWKSLLEMAMGELTDKMIVPICSVIIAGEEALGSVICFPPVYMVVSQAVYGNSTETCPSSMLSLWVRSATWYWKRSGEQCLKSLVAGSLDGKSNVWFETRNTQDKISGLIPSPCPPPHPLHLVWYQFDPEELSVKVSVKSCPKMFCLERWRYCEIAKETQYFINSAQGHGIHYSSCCKFDSQVSPKCLLNGWISYCHWKLHFPVWIIYLHLWGLIGQSGGKATGARATVVNHKIAKLTHLEKMNCL